MNRIGYNFSALALALAAGPMLIAQATSGSLTGVVKDANGTPIVGAHVTISSTALFAPKVVITNDKGEFRFSLLPAGDFRITARKDGFIQAAVEDKRIGLGASAIQSFTLKPIKEATATVEVVGISSSTVDKADTKAATNVSSEELEVLPTSDRGINGALQMAPGVVFAPGGGITIRGGMQNQTQFSVNGADVKDPVQNEITSTTYVEDNIEDVQVVVSPLNARFGRTMGGSVNAVTKSGSDTFHGSARSDFNRNTWNGINNDYHPYPGSTSPSSVTDDLQRTWTFTVNGPIVPGRVWFSTAIQTIPQAQQDERIPTFYNGSNLHPVLTGATNIDDMLKAGPGNGYSFTTFDQGAAYTMSSKHTYYEGKITAAVAADHTVDFSYSRDDNKLQHRDPFSGGLLSRLPTVFGGNQEDLTQSYTVNYKGVLTPNLLLEARATRRDSHTTWPQGDPLYPNNGDEVYVYQGKGTTAGSRAGFSAPFNTGFPATPEKRDNRSGNINLEWLPEGQQIDFGVDYYQAIYKPNSQGDAGFVRLGGAVYNPTTDSYLFPTINSIIENGKPLYGQDATGLRGPAASFIQNLGPTGPVKNENIGLYANDQWTINSHWNLMGGLRADRSKCIDTDGSTISSKTFWSPRFQLTYDLKGDSSHVLKMTAARYFSDFNMSFLSTFSKSPSSKAVYMGWSANPSDPKSGNADALQWITYQQAVDHSNYNNFINYNDTSHSLKVDPNLTAPHADELTFSYVRTWNTGAFLRLTYVHKNFVNDWGFTLEDQPDYLVQFQPTGVTLPAGHDSIYTWQARIANSKELTRKYDALELEWSAKLSSIWSMRGTFTYSSLTGNNNGGDSGSGTFASYGSDQAYYNYNFFNHYTLAKAGYNSREIDPTGSLTNDTPLRGTLALTATVPAGKGHIAYSLLMTYSSGSHWDLENLSPNPAQTWPLPQGAPAFPCNVWNRYWGEQRNQYSNNDMYYLDANISWDIPLGMGRTSFIGNFKIFNLLNLHEPAGYNTNLYSDSSNGMPIPFPDYSQLNGGSHYGPGGFGTYAPGTAGAYWQSPRSVTASIGLKF
jgi:hypothetical protein